MACVVCLEETLEMTFDWKLAQQFSKFCDEFLKGGRDNGDGGGLHLEEGICGRCAPVMRSTLKMYEQWRDLKIHLLGSVGRVGELIQESPDNSRRGSWMEIKQKCFEKSLVVRPSVTLEDVVAVHRDPVKEEVDFEEPMSNSETGDNPEELFEGEDTRQLEDDKPVRRSARRKRSSPSSPVESEAGSLSGDRWSSSDDEQFEATPPRKRQRRRCRKIKLEPTPGWFQCQSCPREFKFFRPLVTHTCKSHDKFDGMNLRACSICTASFPDVSQLRNHLETEHETDKKFIFCVHCSDSFTTRQLCDLHRLLAHIDKSPMLCPVDACSKNFMSISKYNVHLESHMSCDDMSTCDQCGIHVQSSDDLHTHKQVHVPPQSDHDGDESVVGAFLCDYCPEVFSSQMKRKYHFKVAHMNKFNCNWCPKICKYLCHLKKHVKNQHPSNLEELNRLYPSRLERQQEFNQISSANSANEGIDGVSGVKCVECRYTTMRKRSLQKHTFHSHEKVDGISLKECDTCHQSFSDVTKLQKHLQSCHESDSAEKNLVCFNCSRKFATRQMCDLHLYLGHLELFPISCPVEDCSSIFISIPRYSAHLQSHQPEVPLHTCELCSVAFQNGYHLELHKLAHLPPAPDGFVDCPAPVCELKPRFKAVNKLQNHFNATHVEPHLRVELFQCKICQKSPTFFFPKDLAAHQKIHSDSLTCQFCQETFSGRNALNVHQYSQHPENRGAVTSKIQTENPPAPPKNPSGTFRSCLYCPETFDSFTALKKHKFRAHGIHLDSGREFVQCELCGASFQKRRLKRHMLRNHPE